MQRPAKPFTPVRFRLQPPDFDLNEYQMFYGEDDIIRFEDRHGRIDENESKR
tara:strand:- start:30 stop:185 length:156 start_codon:yes stop_codon:yes gene_type:complete